MGASITGINGYWDDTKSRLAEGRYICLDCLLAFCSALLNSIIGILAGRQYSRYGLITAIGVHFWANISWHILGTMTLSLL
jgi:hypothetical protein